MVLSDYKTFNENAFKIMLKDGFKNSSNLIETHTNNICCMLYDLDLKMPKTAEITDENKRAYTQDQINTFIESVVKNVKVFVEAHGPNIFDAYVFEKQQALKEQGVGH